MTVSSNFGNIFSLLFASIFLPFLPMAPVHLIVLNLVYDISCIALPFDNVDKEFLKEPHIWEAKSIMRFMAWFGPISSVFDIFDLHLALLHHCANDFGAWLCSWFTRSSSLYHHFPNRLVYRIYVVSNHGYPHVTFTKTTIYSKSPSTISCCDNLICCFLCDFSSIQSIG